MAFNALHERIAYFQDSYCLQVFIQNHSYGKVFHLCVHFIQFKLETLLCSHTFPINFKTTATTVCNILWFQHELFKQTFTTNNILCIFTGHPLPLSYILTQRFNFPNLYYLIALKITHKFYEKPLIYTYWQVNNIQELNFLAKQLHHNKLLYMTWQPILKPYTMAAHDLMWLYSSLTVFSSKNSKLTKPRKLLHYKFSTSNLVHFEASNKCCKLSDVILILPTKTLQNSF